MRIAALNLLMGLPPETLAPHTAKIATNLSSEDGRTPHVSLKLLAKLPAEALAKHAVPAVVGLLQRSGGNDTQQASFEVLKALRPADLMAVAGDFAFNLLEHPDSSMRVAVINLLGSLLDAKALSEYGSALVKHGLRHPEDPDVRSAATAALVKLVKAADGISNGGIAQELVDTLRAKEAGAHNAAQNALEQLVPLPAGKTLIEPLLALLDQPQSESCGAALEVLARHHALSKLSTDLDKRVMDCFTAGSTTVQASALNVLAKFEPLTIANHAAALAVHLGSEEWELPSKVADVLCKLEPDTLAEHQPALIKSVEHAEWAVRTAALRVLGMLPPTSLEEAAPQIIEAALKDDDATVRDEALEVLAKVPPRALNQHAPLLASSVNHELPSVRKAAMQGLAKLEPSALEPYGKALVARLADDDEDVGSVACKAFARLPRMSRVALAPRVAAHLTHRDKDVRSIALEACDLLDHAALDTDNTKQTLVAATKHEDAQVREAAMDALAKICRLKPRELERTVSHELMKWLRDDEPTVRAAALRMLNRLPMPTLHGEEVVKAVIRRLEDSESVVRGGASDVFTSFLPAAFERVRDQLIPLLSHAEQATRSIAASVLARLPAAALTPLYDTLVGMLDDDSGREVAKRLLMQLSASTLAPLCDKLVLMLDDEKRQQVAIALLKKIFSHSDSKSLDLTTKAKHAAAIVKLASDRSNKGKSINDLLELLSTCGASAIKANAKTLSTLKTPKGEERGLAGMLAQCKDLAFVEAMVPQLVRCLQDKSFAVRSRAINALAKLRDGAFRKQLPAILGMLNDEDEVPRNSAVRSLTQLSPHELKGHVAALTRTLDDPDYRVQSQVMELCSKGLDPTTLDGLVPKLLEKLKASEYISGEFAESIVLALSRLSPAALRKHAAAFVSVLQLADDANQVLRALMKKPLRDGKITKLLLELANMRADDYLASKAIRALGALGPEEAHRDLLLATLQQSDAPESTDAAVWALHRLPPAELQQYGAQFVALLSDKSADIRSAGVKALAKLGPTGIAEHAAALARLLGPNEDKGVQTSALQVLVKMDGTMDPAARAMLTQPIIALVAPTVDKDVQLAALRSLAKMGSSALATLGQPIVVPESDIVALIDERHPSDVRCAALDVMAAFAPETLEKHRPLLFEHIDVVQETNAAALRAIGALAPPRNRDFARQLAALTEHLREPFKNRRLRAPERLNDGSPGEEWDAWYREHDKWYAEKELNQQRGAVHTGALKALLSLSRAQLSFCTQLVMASLTPQLEANSETTSSAVLLLGRLWLGMTLEVPKAPEK